jgi:hypothetical protein
MPRIVPAQSTSNQEAYDKRRTRHPERRYAQAPDDAHPRDGHLSAHDDPLRGGARIERPRVGRGAEWRPPIFLATQHDASVDEPTPDDIYNVGVIGNIVQSVRMPDGNIKVLVEGVERARASEINDDDGFFIATVKTSSASCR